MNYIEKVKKFHKLSARIRKIQYDIIHDFVSYCWEKYPNKISKLEEKINKKIITMQCVRYIYKDRWCEVLFINNNIDGYVAIVVSHDDGWDKSQKIVQLTYETDNDIIKIIEELFNEFPYITEKYL